MTLETDFDDAMLGVYRRVGSEVNYWAGYFLRSVRRNGGLEAAKRILHREGEAGKTKGFHALADAGRLDLSVESLVLEPLFQSLFSEEELAIARDRLLDPARGPRRVPVPVDELFAEEVTPGLTYVVGAVTRVIVNRYERDKAARNACIAKHGTQCKVCDFAFEEDYGALGVGFIHVHHVKPLAGTRVEYLLDPIKDLVPVCPNCHAMLHTSNPPLSVVELRKIRETNSQTPASGR